MTPLVSTATRYRVGQVGQGLWPSFERQLCVL